MRHNTKRWMLCLFALASFCAAAAPQQAPQQSEPKVVRLVIDYGDGVEKHFTRIPCKSRMTVLDAMNQAKEWSHGITFRYTGRGATAFLTQIDDVKNQGGAGNNWLFRVNGKLATKSFGIQGLQAGDRVSWTFQKYRGADR